VTPVSGSTNTVSLLTPPGVGALAVVRVAGPKTVAFVDAHFSRQSRELRCVHGALRDEAGATVDDPVIVLGAGGAFADVSLHGSPWIASRVVEMAERFGFARDDNAWGRVESDDDIERDVLESLPRARTELALRVLLAQPAAWAALRSNPTPTAVRRAVEDAVLANLLRVPRVAIVGVPNGGKSTLANRLFGSDRSITADMPGTTRDWVGEIADIDGLAVMLVDTPGVRETADPIERRAIEIASGEVAMADLVVVVIDASRPIQGGQAELLAQFPNALVVINKVDVEGVERSGIRADVRTVATEGIGVDELRRAIARRFGCEDVEIGVARCWTRGQRDSFNRASAP
jgi:small GTP-binding protein